MFTDLFHGIYKQQIEPQKAKTVIIAIATVAVLGTIIFSGINYFSNDELVKKTEIKKEVKKPEIKKEKKPEIKKEVKKPENTKKAPKIEKNKNLRLKEKMLMR